MSEENQRIEAERDLSACEAVLVLMEREGYHGPRRDELERLCREMRRVLDIWAEVDKSPRGRLN